MLLASSQAKMSKGRMFLNYISDVQTMQDPCLLLGLNGLGRFRLSRHGLFDGLGIHFVSFI
jgi:hypothetical protein